MKPKLMTAHFPGTCKRCKSRFTSGTPIYWAKETGAICTKCGEEGKPEIGPDKAPAPVQETPKPEPPIKLPPAPKPVPGKPHDFTIDWVDLKEILRKTLAGKMPRMRADNARVLKQHILEPTVEWNGYSAGQISRWLDEGFRTEAIQGLSEFTPLIREKRRLQYLEEGDEFHADIAMSGEENFMSSWTKRPTIPGVSLDCIVTFAASTPAEVVNAYNVWICRTVYSLESAGIDCEVNLNFTTDNPIDGLSGRTNTRVRVKKENEVTDFLSISPMLSPAAFRGFLFAATAVHAEAKGKTATYGLGTGPNEMQFGVKYDPDTKRIVVSSQRIGASVFPETRMISEFREALKDAMKG